MREWKREGVLMLLAAFLSLMAGTLAWLGLASVRSLSGAEHLIVLLNVLVAAALPLFVHRVMRQRSQPGDPVILPIVFALSGVGMANLLGAAGRSDLTFATRHSAGMFVGAILVVILAGMSYAQRRALLRYDYLWALLALLLGILLLLFGTGPGGTRLRIFNFLPVEFIKLLLVLFVAGYAARHFGSAGPVRTGVHWWQIRWQEVLPLLVMFGLLLGIFALARDFGPALTMYLTLLMMLYLMMGKGMILALGGLLLVAGVALAEAMGIGVLPTRVAMWLSPWSVQEELARHLSQCLWGMSTGGIFGTGLGLGNPGYVPYARSDSVFSTWGEQLGLVGVLCLLCLYALWVGRVLRIAQRAAHTEDRLVAAGVAVLQGTQVVLICAGTVGLLPMTGMSLPFVAQGNSALLASFAMVGILYNITAFPSAHPLRSPSSKPVARLRALAWAYILLIPCLIGGWCVWFQGWRADDIATREVLMRTAKGELQYRVANPRLETIARRIPRGRILDASGAVLAETQGGRRVYPCGEACAQLVGWLDARYGGPSGAEARYNRRLRGYRDSRVLLALYRRKDLPFYRLPAGQDVTLTVLLDAQQRALRALQRAYPDGHGAFVLLDVPTGQVRAAVGLPTFDPNRLNSDLWQRLRTRRDAPLIFRPVDGLYAPGSVFKVVTAAAALEEGVPLRYTCRHVGRNIRWKVGDKTYSRARLSDHPSMRAHGTLGLRDALRLSCNLYFAHLAIKLQPEVLSETARSLGFTHVPKPDEMAAELPECGFGQGKLLASPLEVANLMATVARGGVWWEAVFSPRDGVRRSAISDATAEALQQMMNEVVQTGTAYGIFSGTGWEVFGKTGTAETSEGNRKPHGWFAGVIKTGESTLAFALILEHGGSGRQAARTSRQILQEVLPALQGR